MTRKQRSILFFIMLFIFLITGPVVIYYSQGYRFDFENRKIIQTGAFYFRITPRNVSIFITPESQDNYYTKNTDFIFGTAYVENLIPKKYHIKIECDGYHSWQKTMEINEKMVTKFNDITLIDANPNFEVILQNIQDFFYFPEINTFVMQKEDPDNKQNLLLSIYNQRNNTTEPVFSYDKRYTAEIIQIINKRLLIKTKENKKYYITNDKQEVINIDLPKEIEKVSFYPKDENKIMFHKDNKIFLYDIRNKQNELLLSNVLSYNIRGDNTILWLSNKGFVFRDIQNPKRVNRHPLEIKQDKEYTIIFPNVLELAIKENNSFYLLDKEILVFKKKFDTPYNPITSPNFQKMVHFNDHEINVFFLKDIFDQPQRKYKDNVFLTRFSEKIENVNWYTSHYIAFTVNDRIKIMEIDNRDHINIVLLAQFENPKMFFSFPEKKIYLLSNNNLFVSKKLIP